MRTILGQGVISCEADFAFLANHEEIPLMLEELPSGNEIVLTMFERDEAQVRELMYRYLPAIIWVHYEVVPNQIGFRETALLEHKKRNYLKNN